MPPLFNILPVPRRGGERHFVGVRCFSLCSLKPVFLSWRGCQKSILSARQQFSEVKSANNGFGKTTHHFVHSGVVAGPIGSFVAF
jgi:hypothetical protein